MKSILFITNTMGRAGAETAMVELMRRLEERADLSVLSLIPCGEMYDALPKSVHILNAHWRSGSVHTPAGRRGIAGQFLLSGLRHASLLCNLPYLIKNLTAQLKKGRVQLDKLCWRVFCDGAPRPKAEYDLAVAFLEGGATYYAARHVKAKKKYAFVHIDYPDAGYTPSLDAGCYSKMERIFVVSGEVGTRFVSVYPEYAGKVKLFENLLDAERIRALAQQQGGFTDGFAGRRLLSVGRLTEQKAYDIAIPACKQLVDAGADVRWYVLGEGGERKRLEKQIAELGLQERFILLGFTDNPYPYIRQADIFMQTTRFEGKSIAVEEAQILGRPIIASDCTGNREQIASGIDGLLVPLTPEAIAAAACKLLADPALADGYAAAAAIKRNKSSCTLEAFLTGEESPCAETH